MNDLTEKLLGQFTKAKCGVNERIAVEIERNRKGWGSFYISDSDGKPVPGVEIKVKQTGHEFLFGSPLFMLNGFDSDEKNKEFETRFTQVFNHAIVPFFWGTLEPEQGHLRFKEPCEKIYRRPTPDTVLNWCEENNIVPKAHWLLCDNFCPDWLPKNSRSNLSLIDRRIRQIADAFGDRVNMWDVINEAFSYLRDSLTNPSMEMPDDYVYRTFKIAEKYLPSSELIYNDGTGTFFLKSNYRRENSAPYLLISRLLERGTNLSGIGMQFHQYGPLSEWCCGQGEIVDLGEGHAPLDTWWLKDRLEDSFNPNHLLKVLDLYKRFDLPIHISEVSLSTVPDLPREEAEWLQAELLKHFFALWFSHESVESITWWTFVDGTAHGHEAQWNSGLLNNDFTSKPSFNMLDHLVNHEWHTEESIVTDEDGYAQWKGFYGSYEALVGADHKAMPIELTKYGSNEFRLNV